MKRIGVYILQCRNQRYYVGSTNDIDRRLHEHQSGHVRATQYILPIHLAFFQSCATLTDARRIEYGLKRKKNKAIIEQVIKDGRIKSMRA